MSVSLAFMVIRFEKCGRKGLLPLFDRLQQQKSTVPSRRLTAREVEHRQRMLNHLQSVERRLGTLERNP
jgi:hypothetical protein